MLTTAPHCVATVRCADYGAAVPEAVRRLLALLPLPEVSGRRVLVKPNLLCDRPPEAAVTTHPDVIRAVIAALRAAGAQVTVADSPASAANLDAVWQTTGIAALCQELDVPLISLESAGATRFTRNGFTFSVANPVLEADLVVNLPKVKSHALTALTAAVKNFYGVIPGYEKALLHKRYSRPETFGHLLETLAETLPPTFTIADGIVGMEGQGPANGTPIRLGFLLAANDPFAADLQICRLLHLDPTRVPYLTSALAAGLENQIDARGEMPEIDTFEIPSGTHLLRIVPAWLVRAASPLLWVHPVFDAATCIGCGKCVKACPATALDLARGKPPRLKGSACIGCCCCHEICPVDAIRMTQAPLLRLVGAFKGL